MLHGTDTPSIQQLEALYLTHFDALTEVASEYSIPQGVAQELAHDVLLASLRQASKIKDVRTWLIGAITCAAQTYLGARK